MFKQKVGILILFVVVLGIVSCKKDNNNPTNNQLSKLPPITQTGANTFGCLINGNAVIFNKIACSYVQGTHFVDNNYFSVTLSATDSSSSAKQTISVYIPDIMMLVNNETVALNAPPNAGGWFAKYTNVATDGFVSDYRTTYPTYIAISFANPITFAKVDTVNKILSGTFSLTMIDSGNVTLPITNGRFDVHYKTQ